MTWSPIELVSKKLKGREDIINFASGAPDPKLIPIEDVNKALHEIIEEGIEKTLEYPGTGGLAELRREIRKYLEFLGVSTGKKEIIITAGAQHALNIIANMFLNEKDLFIAENPTFIEAFLALKHYTPRYRAVRVDDKGMVVGEIEKIVKEENVKLVYTIPTAHNPTGTVMSYERRKQLIEICSRRSIIVVEDDPYRPIVDSKIEPLTNMDKDGIVVYVGSFSKIIAPGLRIGYILAPRELVEKIEQLQQLDFATNTLSMHIMLKLFKYKTPYKAMKKASREYTERIKLLLDLLEDYMPSNTEWTKPKGGFYVLLRTSNMNMTKLLDHALREGVAYVPAQLFYIEKPDPRTARLSISRVNKEQMEKGVKILSNIIKQYST